MPSHRTNKNKNKKQQKKGGEMLVHILAERECVCDGSEAASDWRCYGSLTRPLAALAVFAFSFAEALGS